MSKNFLYVIEAWEGRKLLFDSIRATAIDARRRKRELKATFHMGTVKIVRYKQVRPNERA